MVGRKKIIPLDITDINNRFAALNVRFSGIFEWLRIETGVDVISSCQECITVSYSYC